MRPIHLLVALCLAPFGIAQSSKAAMATLESAKSRYSQAKTTFQKSPKDAKKKSVYVKATVDYGLVAMNSLALPPKSKYPLALNLFREALKHDPKNRVAVDNKERIVTIYKSMGRPIPK